MKNSTRYLIAGGAAVAVLATSFALTRAVAAAEVTPVDAAIDVPAFETAQADVLAPVFIGEDTSDSAQDLSPTVGTAQVTVPAGGSDPSGTPEPSASEEATPPPGVVAAAAALDSAAGEVMDVVASPSSASPAPLPSDGTEPSPASDPCADAAEGDGCPEGYAMTLYDIDLDLGIEIRGMGDPFTTPDEGSNLWCEPTEVPAGAVRLGALATEAGTVSVRYSPVDNPSDVHTTELTQIEEFADGSTRHCGQTEVLAGGVYRGILDLTTDDERMSEPREFMFDSRGRPTVPIMKVVPLGTNWLWVGLKHTAHETALVNGYAVTPESPVACGEPTSVRPLRQDIETHTSEVTAAALSRHHEHAGYIRSTSALIYVPPGTSAELCGLTFSDSDPSWDRSVPERVQSATAESPNSWEAVLTIRSLSTYNAGAIELLAFGQTGRGCGHVFLNVGGEPTENPVITPVGQTLCAIAGQNPYIEVRTRWSIDDRSVGSGSSFKRFLLAGDNCSGPCRQPDPYTYSIFLPGLGQDECPESTSDDCELRRRTMGASATLDIDWRRTSDSSASRWTVSGIGDSNIADPTSDSPQFDTDATFTTDLAGATFQTATATATLKWDRVVDFHVQPMGDCYRGDAPTVSGTSTPAGSGVTEARVRFTNLCPGTQYRMVAIYDDADGNNGSAAPSGTSGVAPSTVWRAGLVEMPQKYLRVKAAITLTTPASFPASYNVRDSWLHLDGDGFVPSFGEFQSDRCFASSVHSVESEPGIIVVPLRDEYTLTQDFNVYSDFYTLPRNAECWWSHPGEWIEPTAKTLLLSDLVRGITVAGELQDSEFATNPRPFSYQIRFTATIQDSPTDS